MPSTAPKCQFSLQCRIRRACHLQLRVTDLLPRDLEAPHLHRRRMGEDNWGHIVNLYDALLLVCSSPGALLNPALALHRHKGGTKERTDTCVLRGIRLWAGVHAGNERAHRSNDDILMRRRQPCGRLMNDQGGKGR